MFSQPAVEAGRGRFSDAVLRVLHGFGNGVRSAGRAQGLPHALEGFRFGRMDETSPHSIIENCPACGGPIDVTDELPFAQIYCPHCTEGMRARKTLNNFELVELLGEGGMGSVFKAFDHTLQRMVALKLLKREMSANEDERRKLEQEARITASVNNPHVVRVYSFGEASGQFYLAMELVEKGTLDDLMAIQTRVPEAQVLEIGVQIAQGLEAASEKGLIHRDVKPGNILFADAHTTKIVDFGLARVLEEEAEARGEIWGTPYYIAPERLNYEPEDFRSDIYSLGGTLFHAIAGRPPFEAENAGLVALKQLKSQRVSLEAFAPDVAPETAYVVNRMLEKNPDDRYASYGELIEDLEFARAKVLEQAGRPAGAKREVVAVETSRSKLYVSLITVAVAGVVLAAGLLMFFTSERPEIKASRDALFARKSVDPMESGMRALAEGNWQKAQAFFSKAVEAHEITTEQGQWARVNLATALALENQQERARATWKDIRQAGLFSERPEHREVGNMFQDAANFGLRETPVRLEDMGSYPSEGAGALSYFFAGLADWRLGDRSEATGIWLEFLDKPQPMRVPFWDDYKATARLLMDQL